MIEQKEFIVPKKAGRLDSFLSEQTQISRSKIKKHIENGDVFINGACCLDASKKLLENDCVCFMQKQEESSVQAIASDLTIYYQDKHLAVIEKSANLTVHPCPSCQEETLVHHLLHHFPVLQQMEGERPGIVHRLDKDTSGLMVIALTEECRLRLVEMFAEKEVQKTYLALVQGICKDGESKESIGRHPTQKTKMAIVPNNKGGREAYSEWKRLYPLEVQANTYSQEDNFSLMEVAIHTGRTHQIRVHLTSAGYPLLGDEVYAPRKVADRATRQMLHAYKLSFHHPITQEYLEFKSLPPQDFWDTMYSELCKKQEAIALIVTGSSGTGKSHTLEIAKGKNFPTFSADECINELYQVNNDAWYLLKNQYGSRFVPNSKKPVDKKALLDAMHNPAMRQELESLLHPLVYTRMYQFFKENQKAELAIAEIPLWFESKPHFVDLKPQTLCISTEENIRLQRLKERGWNEETIDFMESIQLSQEEKITYSTYHINNSGTKEEFAQNIEKLFQTLLTKHNSHAKNILERIQKSL